jgi:hypothetical protein
MQSYLPSATAEMLHECSRQNGICLKNRLYNFKNKIVSIINLEMSKIQYLWRRVSMSPPFKTAFKFCPPLMNYIKITNCVYWHYQERNLLRYH